MKLLKLTVLIFLSTAVALPDITSYPNPIPDGLYVKVSVYYPVKDGIQYIAEMHSSDDATVAFVGDLSCDLRSGGGTAKFYAPKSFLGWGVALITCGRESKVTADVTEIKKLGKRIIVDTTDSVLWSWSYN